MRVTAFPSLAKIVLKELLFPRPLVSRRTFGPLRGVPRVRQPSLRQHVLFPDTMSARGWAPLGVLRVPNRRVDPPRDEVRRNFCVAVAQGGVCGAIFGRRGWEKSPPIQPPPPPIYDMSPKIFKFNCFGLSLLREVVRQVKLAFSPSCKTGPYYSFGGPTNTSLKPEVPFSFRSPLLFPTSPPLQHGFRRGGWFWCVSAHFPSPSTLSLSIVLDAKTAMSKGSVMRFLSPCAFQLLLTRLWIFLLREHYLFSQTAGRSSNGFSLSLPLLPDR